MKNAAAARHSASACDANSIRTATDDSTMKNERQLANQCASAADATKRASRLRAMNGHAAENAVRKVAGDLMGPIAIEALKGVVALSHRVVIEIPRHATQRIVGQKAAEAPAVPRMRAVRWSVVQNDVAVPRGRLADVPNQTLRRSLSGSTSMGTTC